MVVGAQFAGPTAAVALSGALLLDGFSLRLRDPLDSDELTAALMEVVEGSVQPAHVSLWLRRRDLGMRWPGMALPCP